MHNYLEQCLAGVPDDATTGISNSDNSKPHNITKTC